MNRKIFFDAVRADMLLFKSTLSVDQVQGMTAVLDEWDRRGLKDLRWLAYMLGTSFHETATTMQPVIETRQPKEKTNPSVDEAIRRLEKSWAKGSMPWVKRAYWRKDARGMSWLGRGLPQVTHFDNYLKAEKATGIPFTKNPELMLVLKNAVPVMFDGMIDGWFAGHKLADYFVGTTSDWFNARRIINATESAVVVATYSRQFYAALLKARSAPAEVVVRVSAAPVAPPIPAPVTKPAASPPLPVTKPDAHAPQPPQGGFFARIAAAFGFIKK